MLATSFLIFGARALLVSPFDNPVGPSFLAVVADLMGAVAGLASGFLARNSVLPVLEELLRTSALMILVAGRGVASLVLLEWSAALAGGLLASLRTGAALTTTGSIGV